MTAATWIGAIAAVVSVLLALSLLFLRSVIGVAKRLWAIAKRTEQFLEDFNGTEERPGVPARPGVLARLQTMDGDIATIKAELSYNSGSTVKDAVRRIDQNVAAISAPTVTVQVNPSEHH